MKKKKIIIGVIIAVILLVAIGISIFFITKKSGKNSDKVYVESVATVMGVETGATNRFAGVVEAQESWEINQDNDKEVAEVFVKVGDTVKEGDKLFSYKTDDTSSQIATQQLEIESIDNKINEYNAQIAILAAERDAAPEEAKFDYTTQIQSLQNEIQQAEFSKKSQLLEIDKLRESINNSTVTSKMSGVVKSINDGTSDDGSNAFMTIFATGDYRIKCEINEQHISQIQEGMNMAVYSRVNEDDVWSGTIATIEKDSPETNTDEYAMDDSGIMMNSSSKYPFYIALDSTEGLMLGQHVYVKTSDGQDVARKGIWLYESYIVKDGKKAYIWVDNGHGKIEKRQITLGKYDEEMGEYQIKKGLEMSDYITWPMPSLYEGVKTVTDESKVDYEAPMYQAGAEEE